MKLLRPEVCVPMEKRDALKHRGGILLLHDLCGAPGELLPLCQAMSMSRWSAPLLTGHGLAEPPKSWNFNDWIADAERAADALLKEVKYLKVVGLGMGALLAIELGMRRHTQTVHAISPFEGHGKLKQILMKLRGDTPLTREEAGLDPAGLTLPICGYDEVPRGAYEQACLLEESVWSNLKRGSKHSMRVYAVRAGPPLPEGEPWREPLVAQMGQHAAPPRRFPCEAHNLLLAAPAKMISDFGWEVTTSCWPMESLPRPPIPPMPPQK